MVKDGCGWQADGESGCNCTPELHSSQRIQPSLYGNILDILENGCRSSKVLVL